MAERLVWQAQVQFEGTPEQFTKLASALKEQPVTIEILEWKGLEPHLRGCNPMALEVLIGPQFLERLVADKVRVPIEDIPGGIRVAHLHLGDEVVLLDRSEFVDYAGRVAQTLAQARATEVADYTEVMVPIGRLAVMPEPIPGRG